MTTVTIWLLISLGSGNRPSVLIERFADQNECQKVAQSLNDMLSVGNFHKCQQAIVLKDKK